MLASPFGHSRIGVIVPKHQHSAVDRNRLKRRLRELVRVELLPRLRERTAVDLVIRANAEAYRASFVELRREVSGLLGRIDATAPDRS